MKPIPKIVLQTRPELDGDAESLATIVDNAIDKALQRTGGNVTQAAALLDIDRRTVYRRVAKMTEQYRRNPPQIQEPDPA